MADVQRVKEKILETESLFGQWGDVSGHREGLITKEERDAFFEALNTFNPDQATQEELKAFNRAHATVLDAAENNLDQTLKRQRGPSWHGLDTFVEEVPGDVWDFFFGPDEDDFRRWEEEREAEAAENLKAELERERAIKAGEIEPPPPPENRGSLPQNFYGDVRILSFTGYEHLPEHLAWQNEFDPIDSSLPRSAAIARHDGTIVAANGIYEHYQGRHIDSAWNLEHSPGLQGRDLVLDEYNTTRDQVMDKSDWWHQSYLYGLKVPSEEELRAPQSPKNQMQTQLEDLEPSLPEEEPTPKPDLTEERERIAARDEEREMERDLTAARDEERELKRDLTAAIADNQMAQSTNQPRDMSMGM